MYVHEILISKKFYIRGINPSKEEILSYLNQMGYNEWYLPKMIMHESKMSQFNSGTDFKPDGFVGCPNWGAPNGYGLMQLDNFGDNENGSKIYATTHEIWNWKSNIDRGVRFLREDKAKWARDKMEGYMEKYNEDKHRIEGPIKYYIAEGPNAGLEVIELREGNNTEYEIFSIYPTERERSMTDAITIRYYNGGLYCKYKHENIKKGISPWIISPTNSKGFNYVERICETKIH